MKENKLILLLPLILISSSCANSTPSSSISSKVDSSESSYSNAIVCQRTVDYLLKDTIYETAVYTFKSNVAGPKIAIVGGIHGDEVAGWKAGLLLKDRKDFVGEVMIIPQANILADKLEQRYPGYKQGYDGIIYSDLNRTFPGKEEGTETERISYEIANCVRDFAPNFIVDLHESLASAKASYYEDATSRLGDTIIYGNDNSAFFAIDLTEKFNASYLEEGDYNFGVDTNSPSGSFNNYFGSEFPESIVYTIETTRYKNGEQVDVNHRINQQLNLLNIMFDISSDYF